MLHGEASGLLAGAVALGAIHGVEPGHGWPVAASYALERRRPWLYGFASSLILGVGHLVSSIAMVGAFFFAKSYFRLTEVNEPITLGPAEVGAVAVGPVEVGGPVSVVAGVVLIGLAVREYRHGHSHAYGSAEEDHGHGHSHADEDHAHGNEDPGHAHSGDDHHHVEHADGGDHSQEDGGVRTIDRGDRPDDGGLLARLKAHLPLVGGDAHDHGSMDDATDRGLWGIAWFAFLLGFAHEEEFEIIALCAGSSHCLELMTAYALTVVVGIVGLTMLLLAGYHRFEDRVEAYAGYLPAFSAAVLTAMGIGFVTGVF
ncbi:MAG: hypothetical protein V5A23_00105 [Halobacteriales archaeon]